MRSKYLVNIFSSVFYDAFNAQRIMRRQANAYNHMYSNKDIYLRKNVPYHFCNILLNNHVRNSLASTSRISEKNEISSPTFFERAANVSRVFV
jgi:hypothetical protein